MAHIDVLGGVFTGSGSSVTSGSGGALGGTARVNVPLHDWWNLQVDLSGLGTFVSGNTTLTHTDLSGTLHLYARMPGWNLGAYAGLTRQSSLDPRFVTRFGGEVGVPLGRFYVGANAGFGLVSDNGNSGTMFEGGVNGRYEFTRNAMVRGDLLYTNFSGIPFSNYHVVSAAITGQYRFDDMPVGLFGTARWDCYSGDISASTFSALFGATIYIDPPGSTLEDQWERGPNWRPLGVALHL